MGIAGNAYFSGTGWLYKTTAPATNYQVVSGQHQWFTAPSGTAGAAISFTQAMTLNTSGRLLLGTTTDDGTNLFQCAGSASFSGVVTAPTATAGTNTTQIATTAFVDTSFAKKASPAFTGTPTAPTAAAGTNTTQVATTAFVTTAISGIGGVTTTSVLNATAGASVGAVGTYAFLKSTSAFATGATTAGSNLRYASSIMAATNANYAATNAHSFGAEGTAPSGTWRLMGYTQSVVLDYPVSEYTTALVSLWLRIS